MLSSLASKWPQYFDVTEEAEKGKTADRVGQEMRALAKQRQTLICRTYEEDPQVPRRSS